MYIVLKNVIVKYNTSLLAILFVLPLALASSTQKHVANLNFSGAYVYSCRRIIKQVYLQYFCIIFYTDMNTDNPEITQISRIFTRT